VVSTTHAGIPEIVSDGEAGLLVPERHLPALVDALETIAGHAERWPEMDRAGREYVEAHHLVDLLAEELTAIYKKLYDWLYITCTLEL